MSLLQSVFDGATAGYCALPIIGIITGGLAAGILGVYKQVYRPRTTSGKIRRIVERQREDALTMCPNLINLAEV